MFEVILLAIALSMDAFAVSLGLGSRAKPPVLRMAALVGVYFGSFQAVMPLLGYLGGHGVLGWMESLAPWVGFGLLQLIGIKMLYEALAEGIEEDLVQVTHRVLLTLAIATSIDALAAGFTLPLLPVNPLLACLLIGLTTTGFSALGVAIGARSGTWLESRAEIAGGVVLILLGFKILLFG